MARTTVVALVAFASILAPAFAGAQTYTPPPPPPSYRPPPPTLPPPPPPVIVAQPVPRSGVALSVGVGISHLRQGFYRDVTQLGAQAEARLIFGAHAPVSLEAGYVGTLRDINIYGPGDDALLMSNGLEATVRINGGLYDAHPYIFGGVGWHLFRVIDQTHISVSDFSDGDATISLPVGAGITGPIGEGLLIDVRFAYRFAFGEDLLTTGIDDSRFAGLDSWSMTVQLAYEF